MSSISLEMEYRFAAGELQFGGEGDARILQGYAARLNKNNYLTEGRDDVWSPPGDSLETVIIFIIEESYTFTE